MTSRIGRLVFGLLPARPADFVDACVAQVPSAVPAGELFPQLRAGRRLSDETLAEYLQNGNADALTYLFERYSPLLYAIARRILRNGAEAEDAVQLIFLDVFRSIRQYDPQKGEFRTWLLMFGYQRILNCRRALVAKRFFDSDPFEEPFAEWLQEGVPAYSLAETSVLIEQGMSQLQLRQRRTIELIYYEGLTAREVAQRTGETVRVVRHNLYRGLEKLRILIGGNALKALGEDRK
jgi:RNA polymerase sigma-70 factor, ECF subfamily